MRRGSGNGRSMWMALVLAGASIQWACDGPGADHPSPAGTLLAASAAPGASDPVASGASCALPAVGTVASECAAEREGEFAAEVAAAIRQLSTPSAASAVAPVRAALLAALQRRGLCAAWADHAPAILQVKNTNGYSEQFDVPESASGLGPPSYRASCYPAAF